jgi:hypothetical protein
MQAALPESTPIALVQELACSSSQLTTQDRDKWYWSQWGANDAPPIGKILSEYLALFFFNMSTNLCGVE